MLIVSVRSDFPTNKLYIKTSAHAYTTCQTCDICERKQQEITSSSCLLCSLCLHRLTALYTAAQNVCDLLQMFFAMGQQGTHH